MIFLVEFGVHDGVSASTLYVDTDGYTSSPSDSPANQYYMPRLKSVGSIERHLFSSGDGVSGGTTGGGSQAGFGNISVLNGKPYNGSELIDSWLNLAFRTVTIKSLADRTQALGSATVRFSGSAEQLVTTRAYDQFDVVVHDRLSDLSKPLLVNTYAGTTTASGLGYEGDVDLAGQIKPKIWGRKNNATCINVNPYDLIYQVNDGAVASITVYDGGLALTNAGNYGDFTSLMSASPIPGNVYTCLNLGIFRLGGKPAFTVTADVVEGSTLATRSAAQIANRIMAWFVAMYPATTASISSASVTALDVLNAAECGIVVTSGETALSALMRVLNSVGGWLIPENASTSLFDVGRLDAPSGAPVTTFDLDDNIGTSPERVETGDSGKGVPSFRVIVKYDQLGVAQKSAELAGAVTDARKAYLVNEWRQQQGDATGVLTQYPNAPTLTVQSCLVNQSDAATEATRLLGLHSVRRDIYRMKVPLQYADGCELGTVVDLQSVAGRLGMTTARPFVVIGRIDDFSPLPTTTLDCWG